MALSSRMRRRIGGRNIIDDAERKLNYALEKGINMFELRYRKRYPFDQKYFGYDDIQVERVERANSADIQMGVRILRGTDICFTPNEENVLTCFIPDTPKNRKLLALTIYDGDFEITRLIMPSGEIPMRQIQEEIRKYATELGVKPPVKDGLTPRQRKNVPHVRKRLTTFIEVEATVNEKHQTLLQALKAEHGDKYKDSTIYKTVIEPDVLALCKTFGIEYAEPAPEMPKGYEEKKAPATPKAIKRAAAKKEETLVE